MNGQEHRIFKRRHVLIQQVENVKYIFKVETQKITRENNEDIIYSKCTSYSGTSWWFVFGLFSVSFRYESLL
jgi:hypothetical protein